MQPEFQSRSLTSFAAGMDLKCAYICILSVTIAGIENVEHGPY